MSFLVGRCVHLIEEFIFDDLGHQAVDRFNGCFATEEKIKRFRLNTVKLINQY